MTGDRAVGRSSAPGVLVGVDQCGSEAALQYAAEEAVLRHADLHLVHVGRPPGPCAPADVDDEVRLRQQAHDLLRRAADRVRQLVGDLGPGPAPSVSVEFSQGSTVRVLESLSRRAELVVLQHHGWNASGDSSTLSVTAGVAAVAHAPVVAVPDAWRLARRPARVVALVEDPWRDRAVSDEALREAGRRQVDVVALQVVRSDAAQPTLFAATSMPLTVVRSDESPATVVGRFVRENDLVVAGRHHRKHAVGAPLGRTARDLVRHLGVPVTIVETHAPGSSAHLAPDTEPRRLAWT